MLNRDLTDPRWIKAKGAMFAVIGATAALLVWLEHPTLKTAALTSIAIWGSCRAYYFAFYVIERYVDPSYRFAGLWSCAIYLVRTRQSDGKTTPSPAPPATPEPPE